MRVLDIDLDFFLADCCPLADMGKRPCLAGHEPWSEAAVVGFMENNCGITSPIPGRIFEMHDAALKFWLELNADGLLTLPFHVTHVDAHSDLGIGKPGPAYVLNTVLAMEPSLRLNIDNFYRAGQLDEANYLLFALALRLISSLENVRNPNSRPDIPAFAHRDACGKYDYIQLSSFVSKLFEAKNGPEPIIPFMVFSDYSEFCADAPFDFISVAISPRYSPKEADELLPVLSRYIKQI